MDMDAGPPDAGPMDMDAGPPDAGPMDMDAGPPDAGPMDMDAGPPDAGEPDAGPPDAGPVPVIVQITSPTPSTSGTLFVVAADHNKNVTNGVAGYIPDSDPIAAGGQITLTANLTASVAGAGTVTFMQGSNVIGVQTVGFDGVSATAVTATVTLTETVADTITVSASDSVGGAGSASVPVRVDVTLPPAATLVTTDPGTGVYTHVINERHADWDAVFVCPTDPNGAPLSYDLGFSTALQLGTQALDETTFDSSSLVTHLTGNCAAPGVATVAPVTGVPPFNLYEYVPQIVDAVGNVQVYPSGPPSTLDTTWQSVTIPYSGPSAVDGGAKFGYQIEIGDVDGDGKIDYAIGALEQDLSGSVTVYYGGSLPPSRTQRFAGTSPSTYFGIPNALGDLNGDGASDLVAYNIDHMEIYLSTPGVGLPTTPSVTITGTSGVYTSRVLSDLTGDGIDDLVLGDPYANSNAGVVYIFEGRATWPATLDLSDADIVITGIEAGGKLGNTSGKGAIALPDMDGDGTHELVLPADAINKVYLIPGATLVAKGTAASTSDATAVFHSSISGSTDAYGYSLLGFDMNADGTQDLLIGGVDPQGKLFEYLQSAGDFNPDPTTAPAASGTFYFGTGMADGDLNGDGLSDLVVESVTNNGPGLSLYFASGTGAVSLSAPSGQASTPGAHALGNDLAVADVNGDALPDILVSSSTMGDGSIYVFY